MSGFKLAPSRLNRPAATEVATARTNFPGLTASKLGLLAESKLTPSSGAIQATTIPGEGGDLSTSPSSTTQQQHSVQPPTTYSFTPLSAVPSIEKGEEKEKEGEEKKEEEKREGPVFGENLADKVVKPPAPGFATIKEKDTTAKENDVNEEKDIFGKPKNGELAKKEFVASSWLFSNPASKASSEENDDDESEKKTLSESAAEYTEIHSNKRKYDVVDVVTGEEQESNVLQAQVKLYIFDKEKRNWTERGRGLLRLNDDPVSTPGHLKSRLVMRTSGNMRVVLNTKLWAEMICEKANEKNVRISALDEGEVKIFLISCSIKEAEKLYTALEYRINQLKTNKESVDDDEEEGGEPPEKKPAPEKEN